MRRLSALFARAAFCFSLHHGYSGSIDLHIEDGNGLTHYVGQIQLTGTLNLPLLALRYVGPDGLRRALHSFGGHLEAGQQLDLPASMVEWRLGPNQRQHAAHTG